MHVDASSFCDGVSDKVLVDALEAVFAALYLDAGAEASDLIIKCLYKICLPIGSCTKIKTQRLCCKSIPRRTVWDAGLSSD